jgi:hypothetical protein
VVAVELEEFQEHHETDKMVVQVAVVTEVEMVDQQLQVKVIEVVMHQCQVQIQVVEVEPVELDKILIIL